MADSSANLKVKATMDNADLKKKCKESQNALRDFSQVSEGAVSKLGEALGIDTSKLEKMAGAVDGLGLKLQQSGNEGAAAFGKMLSGISGVTAGIAGLGLAGALATFKLLSAEAENFKTTLAGANIDTATSAYVDTYKQVIHDFNRELGQGFAETESRWKKFWGTAGATIKAYVTSGAIVSALNPQAQGFGNGLSNFQNIQKQATEAATEAERISNEIYKVQRQISDKTVEWARSERDIAEYKRIAYDKTVDTTTQQQALATAVELINKRYQEEAELRGRLADLQTEYNGLAESSLADIDKANQLRVNEENVIAKMNNTLRELSERQATVTKLVEDEARAREEAVAAEDALMNSRADLMAWTVGAKSVTPFQGKASVQAEVGLPTVADTKIYLEDWWNTVSANLGSIGKLHIGFDPDDLTTIREDMVDISNELQQIMTSSFETVGVAIGGLIGDLATGGDAWGNFANTALSALGDMAVQVGKIAIQTGMSMLGIKAALNFGGPWAAIAAGTALVALGAAIKTSLSNVAKGGDYGASMAVASASGSYGSSSSGFGTGFETREMTVKVTGTLRADGNQLLTVIENENKRKNHTT